MADIAIENYKKGVERAVERFKKKCEPIAKELDKRGAELAELKKAKGDKAEIAQLEKVVAACKAKLEKFAMELKLDLALIEPPAKGKADDKELVKLPGWLKSLAEREFAVGKVKIKPDVDIDLKSFKIKGASLTVSGSF